MRPSVVGASPEAAGWYLQARLLLLLVSRVVRFVLLGIFGATNLLAAMAGLGVVFALTAVLSPTTRSSTDHQAAQRGPGPGGPRTAGGPRRATVISRVRRRRSTSISERESSPLSVPAQFGRLAEQGLQRRVALPV